MAPRLDDLFRGGKSAAERVRAFFRMAGGVFVAYFVSSLATDSLLNFNFFCTDLAGCLLSSRSLDLAFSAWFRLREPIVLVPDFYSSSSL